MASKWYKKLRSSPDDYTVFRAQGALEVLDELIALPDEIRSYLHDVSTGKRKKIEKEIPHGMARR